MCEIFTIYFVKRPSRHIRAAAFLSHIPFPKGHGVIYPSLGHGSRAKAEAVGQTRKHFYLGVRSVGFYGVYAPLHGTVIGDAVACAHASELFIAAVTFL